MDILSKKKWSFIKTCPECKTKLRVYKKDLYVANHAVGYAGETWEPELAIECAECKSTMTVTNKVPSGIREELYDKARERN